MRTTSASLPFLALLLIGCDSSSTSPLEPQRDIARVRADVTGMVPFASQGYEFRIIGSAPDRGCDATGESRIHLTGDGTATHLGSFTVGFSFCSRPDGTLADGRGAFVAANGDQLEFTFDGVSSFLPPYTIDFTSYATFGGGTGRFEGATGTATVTGTVDARTGTGAGRWEGMISSVGSSGR